MRRLLRPKVLIPVAILAAVLFAVVLYVFQPWKLFTTTEVNEALPTTSSDLSAQAPASDAPASSESPTGTDESTQPATPAPEASGVQAQPMVLSKGTFISHEHSTSGNVEILQLADGTRVLRLEDLETSDGPQLEVWLSDQPVVDGVDGWGVFDDGKHVSLGALKGNVGNQNYMIPQDVDLADFTSVSIWCARFHVSFGAAELNAVG